jgi:hypothetical protein
VMPDVVCPGIGGLCIVHLLMPERKIGLDRVGLDRVESPWVSGTVNGVTIVWRSWSTGVISVVVP